MGKKYAVAPGEYLAEWLDDEHLTQQQLADRLGWSRKRVNEIVGGQASIPADVAIQLERVTGIPADSWLRFAYRADLALRKEGRTASLSPNLSLDYTDLH